MNSLAKKQWGGVGVLLLAALTVYWPARHGEFILDDDLWVNNMYLKSWHGLGVIWFGAKLPDYFPLTSTSFWLEWRLWGLNPTGYHVTNVLLHAGSGIVLWRVLRRLAIPGAWLAALLFVVHPVNVESVAWISERKNTLSMLFFLLSALWFLRSEGESEGGTNAGQNSSKTSSPQPSPPFGMEEREKSARPHARFYYGLSLGAFLLALLSKSSVVMLPVVLLGCAWWQRGEIARRDWVRCAPFFGLAGVLGVVTMWFQAHNAIGPDVVLTASFWERLALAGRAVWFYLGKAVWPENLAFIYPRWEVSGLGRAAFWPVAALVLLAGGLWFYRRIRWVQAAGFGLGYFVVMLAPVLGFVDIFYFRYSLVTDHWQYYALIGVMVLEVGGLEWANAKCQIPTIKNILAVAAVLVFSVLSWRQAGLYGSAERLWQDTVAKNPTCWLAQNSLGFVQGATPAAAAYFRTSLRLNPNQPEAHMNLGSVFLNAGENEAARAEDEAALKIGPRVTAAWYGLGVALERLKDYGKAETAYRAATQLDPSHAMAHNNLGSLLQLRGELETARSEFITAAKLDPSVAGVHQNLGLVYEALGRKNEAEAEFREALRLSPDYVEAHNSLGKLLAEGRKLPEAAKEFAEAVRLKPDHSGAQFNFGNALFLQGKRQEALPHFLASLQAAPEIAETHYQAGVILNEQNETGAAVEHMRAAVRLKPGWVEPANNLAWLLATKPEAKYRDGVEAVRLAGRAVELTHTNNPILLDTLAAAYAESSRWPEAIKAEEQALAIKGLPPALAGQMQARLDLYRAGKPFRDLPAK